MFKLTTYFKHEMIGIWQKFQRNVKLSETLNNSVWINSAWPVFFITYRSMSNIFNDDVFFSIVFFSILAPLTKGVIEKYWLYS